MPAVPARPSVFVLGPVEVPGLDGSGVRPVDVELAVYLAVHAGRPVTSDKLRDALGVSGDTVRTYASRVRQALGADRFPPATDGRYQLRGMPTNWARFQELTADAARAGCRLPVTGGPAARRGHDAGRGVPFADSDYDWPERELLVHEMEKAVADAADRMAAVAQEVGRPEWAGWAVDHGLAGIRYPDHRLLAHRLRVGAAQGTSGLTEAWREVNARLAAADDASSPELVDLHDRLRRQVSGGA